jgi:hypothetical protein
MHWFLLLLALLAAPFWESKAPGDWSDLEIQELLTDSPWAQKAVISVPGASGPDVQVYLATAGPIEAAERERDLRARRKSPPAEQTPEDPLASEYRAWLEDNRATQIVVAVRMDSNRGFFDAAETQHMENDSVMRIGRKRFKITGHFPPSRTDPYLRLAFPRRVTPNDKTVTFELYLPGLALPFRSVEFKVKDMELRGRLEM